MSEHEQLTLVVAGLARQVALLRGEVAELRRAGCGDRLVLVELCRVRGWTVAEAMGPKRNEAVRSLRDALSAARVGRIFELSRRQVVNICRQNDPSSATATSAAK